jgi:hypothetical protein
MLRLRTIETNLDRNSDNLTSKIMALEHGICDSHVFLGLPVVQAAQQPLSAASSYAQPAEQPATRMMHIENENTYWRQCMQHRCKALEDRLDALRNLVNINAVKAQGLCNQSATYRPRLATWPPSPSPSPQGWGQDQSGYQLPPTAVTAAWTCLLSQPPPHCGPPPHTADRQRQKCITEGCPFLENIDGSARNCPGYCCHWCMTGVKIDMGRHGKACRHELAET